MSENLLPAIPRPQTAGAIGVSMAGAAAESSDFYTLGRLLASARRLKWIVIGVTAAGTLLGVAVARRIQPTYAVKATLWVDVQDPRLRGEGPMSSGQPLIGPQGWTNLLSSRVVMDNVVRDLRLYLSLVSPADSAAFTTFGVGDAPATGAYTLSVDGRGRTFTLANDAGDVVQSDSVGSPVGAALGWTWEPPVGELRPGRAIAFQVVTPEAAADRLAGAVKVRTDLEGKVGNFLGIELRGANPGTITAVINAVADRFVQVAADLKREKLIGLTRILDAQMQQARSDLAGAEAALRGFRVRYAPQLARSGAGVLRDPAAGAMFELQGSRDQVRRDRQTIQRLLGEAGDGALSVEGLAMIGSVARSPELKLALEQLNQKQLELRALRYKYTDEHLPVQRLAAEVDALQRQTIPALARTLVAQLGARDAEFARQIDSAGSSLRELPPLALEEARLVRNVSIADAVYSGMQTRFQEARLAEVSTLPEVRVLDRAARPSQALYSAKSLVPVLAFFGSLAVGLVAAVLLDRVDPRLRYPEEVTRRMGLAVLGAVPHANVNGPARQAVASVMERGSKLISAVRGREAGLKALPAGSGGARSALGRLSTAMRWALPSFSAASAEERTNQAVEALRGIRLNLVHAYGVSGPMLVTVTSPGRGDGKSFVSSNLALAFADAGHRTLLIDGDIRRGRLHRVLGVNRQPGLIDLLQGGLDRDAVIQQTAYPRLSFIACGTRVHHGPELLGSPAMQRLVAELRSAYEVIIVDSPPLAAGIDAYILGTLTGNMALVLRTGVTDRQLAEAKLDALERLPIRLVGAVINDVPEGGTYRYYSYYLSGYEVEEEPAGRGAEGAED